VSLSDLFGLISPCENSEQVDLLRIPGRSLAKYSLPRNLGIVVFTFLEGCFEGYII
jgi:hypothetical protein